ncbi:deoxynucleoside kinase isoform X2 [Cephus cinctus]|nr:deoxynucleoside kinase isoform X2 [Cephus cinctus]XP_015584811.1 deoxynucleoside kinase isoform X2 [Cephus cinctus]
MSIIPSAVYKRPFTVCIEGNIGSGKTTFINEFKQYNDTTVLQEPVELWRNVSGTNLLELMYKDPGQYACLFQSYVQLTMLQLHTIETPTPYKIMERSVFSARCFIENMKRTKMLRPVESVVLEEWYNWCITNVKLKTDLIIYLRTTPEVVYKRMRERAREEECSVSLEYLQQVHQIHDDWLYHRTLFSLPAPVITLNGDKSIEEMFAEVRKCKEGFFTKADEIMLENGTRCRSEESSPVHITPKKLQVGGSI